MLQHSVFQDLFSLCSRRWLLIFILVLLLVCVPKPSQCASPAAIMIVTIALVFDNFQTLPQNSAQSYLHKKFLFHVPIFVLFT